MIRFPWVRVTPVLIAAVIVGTTGCGGNKPSDQVAASGAPPAATPLAADAAPQSSPAPEIAQPAPAPASTPKPKPVPNPAPVRPPAPAPVRQPIVKTIGAGTEIAVALEDAASSKTSQVGDTLRARVTKTVTIDGLVAIPEGALAVGKITEAVPLKKIGGAASLGVRFDTIELADGQRVPIEASVQAKSKSESGKDAGTIAGATAGGALLGRLLSKHDKTKGTIIGAAVGAAAGTGAAVATKGQEVEFAVGTPFALKLEASTNVTIVP